ncbi:hypothetical protein L1987_55164 [Smallanthus sonchifolius]|uniref:Uncharacterized protein n=1 Tax=Smallanthus sonchifolius TaxID=185202 RepID=A0ACB9EA80_9ASTR|nr:hypothetical protein L1987_55164 [Smallanthus sonchifolius]
MLRVPANSDNRYEMPYRVFLMREMSMRLSSVGMKFDDDTQFMILLYSFLDSWSGFVTAITNYAGTGTLKFDGIRDSVLSEDIPRKNVKCWSYNEVGYVKSQCPNNKKENFAEVNAAEVVYYDDALVCSVESSEDSWLMDSGSLFHAMHSGETMENLKVGNLGKVRIANGDVRVVTGMGDVKLVTSLGTTWNLKNVRVILALKRKLISVGQLDKQGLEVNLVEVSGSWPFMYMMREGLQLGELMKFELVYGNWRLGRLWILKITGLLNRGYLEDFVDCGKPSGGRLLGYEIFWAELGPGHLLSNQSMDLGLLFAAERT